MRIHGFGNMPRPLEPIYSDGGGYKVNSAWREFIQDQGE